MRLTILAGTAAALALGAAAGAQQQQNFENVQIASTDLGHGVYMLTGQGGNIGLLVGDDGVLMIDDEFAPLSEKITAKVAELSGGKTVGTLVNTHHHGDHTGGNANFAAGGAKIFAHENVFKRLSTEQPSLTGGAPTPAQPKAAWPVVTFAQDVTFHMDGQTVHAFHVSPAHTDGDVVIYFEEANVLHAGDVFTTSGLPIVDVGGGGSLEGFVNDLTQIIGVINDDTKVVPGHGVLSTKADVVKRRDALKQFVDILKPLAASDLTIDQIIANKPLDGYDEPYKGGFMTTDNLIRAAVTSMRASK